MPPPFARLSTVIALTAALSSVAKVSEAATFRVEFAGRSLGTVIYSDDAGNSGGGQFLRTSLDNSPFGLFDGTFEAGSKPDGPAAGSTRILYASKSRSTRKARDIFFRVDAGRVKETVVSPVGEKTLLSVPEAVMDDVIDPVAAFGRFVHAQGCPDGFKIYDGRRIDEVARCCPWAWCRFCVRWSPAKFGQGLVANTNLDRRFHR